MKNDISPMYKSIEKNEAKKIVDSCKWILKKDLPTRNLNDGGETHFLINCYSGKQTFGGTDYKDHRNDTLEQIKKKIYDSITCKTDFHQRLHYYYDKDKKIPFNTIICQGYNGGVTAYFEQL
jgi:hypothetical protein